MAIKGKEHQERIKSFLEWFKNCKGSEKGEGQIFFDRLFQAFGNTGVLVVRTPRGLFAKNLSLKEACPTKEPEITPSL